MYWDQEQKTGFNFDKVDRNNFLIEKKGLKLTTTKTGTTIVGVVYNEGVVIGADTRATSGSIVADPDCMKIHYLAPNIYCCGAGTAADCEFVTQMIESELELHRLTTGTESRISHAEARLTHHLFRYQGHVGAALILGGVDVTGPHLLFISPHGNSHYVPFGSMGSGSLAAMGVLETKYKDNLTKEQAMELVKDAIEAGIFHDLGSGSNVDIYVVKREGVEKHENYRVYNKKMIESVGYTFPKGTTEVIEEVQHRWKNIRIESEEVRMELS